MSGLFAMWLPGWQELLIVAFIMMLLFPKRLSSMMFGLGSSLNSFREGLNEPAGEQPEQKEPAA
jgi:Sec-independent protein translocase protein TatA